MISSTCLVVVPSCTDWTSAPRSGGPGEARGRGGRVQADHAEQRPPVAAPEPARLRAQLVAVGDREQLVHRSSPRVTVQR